MTAAVPSPSNASLLEQAKAAMQPQAQSPQGQSKGREAGSATTSPTSASERKGANGPLRVITPQSSNSSALLGGGGSGGAVAMAGELSVAAVTPSEAPAPPSLTSSFLASSPSASPQLSSSVSPFMSLSSPLTPVTATTASTSSVGSAQPPMPLSPLSPFTPSLPRALRLPHRSPDQPPVGPPAVRGQPAVAAGGRPPPPARGAAAAARVDGAHATLPHRRLSRVPRLLPSRQVAARGPAPCPRVRCVCCPTCAGSCCRCALCSCRPPLC